MQLFAQWNIKGYISARLFNIDLRQLESSKGLKGVVDLEMFMWMARKLKYNPETDIDYVSNLYNQCQPKSELPVKYTVDCLKEIINVSSLPF